MIEVNKQAKPFNRVESLIGADLFNMLRRSTIFGRNYYDPSRPTKSIDILGQLKTTVGLNTVMKLAKKEKWEDKFVNEGLPNLYQWTKQVTIAPQPDTTRLNFFLACKAHQYEDLMRAQEVCRYLQSLSIKDAQLDKLLVIELHKLITENVQVKLNEDFTFNTLVHVPIEPHDGFGTWAPPPVAQMWQEQAAHNDAMQQQINAATQQQINAATLGMDNVDVLTGMLNQMIGGNNNT